MRFHIDYFKPEDEKKAAKAGTKEYKQAVAEAILSKHNASTYNRRYNAIFATASINDAIEYFELLQELQKDTDSESSEPLNIACVFSPPAEGNKDVKQLQEELLQEKADNEKEPDKKKAALKAIIFDYNQKYGTSHSINNFDLYYQDVQKRIKDQQYTNADYPHKNKIDIVIVVDMLLTGFDSKYLNTLYVDKNLKQHGLIQAFSRTNRVLNPTKPYGNIIDFRGHENEVNEAIKLFSGKENAERVKEIWLVDPAPVVLEKLDKAFSELEKFMESQGLECKPEEVSNLKGDMARAEFIDKFKEVQRLKTQLDQYTDIKEGQVAAIQELLPEDTLRAFRGAYIETAQRLKEQQGKDSENNSSEVGQLDFEFVLFSSAIIDYDYIMALISKYTQPSVPKKEKMTKKELISLICSTSNFMDEHEDIEEYINTLEAGKGLDEKAIRAGYRNFKTEKFEKKVASVAGKYGIVSESLQAFIDKIMERMIFDGEKLSDLLEPLDLGWRERTQKELELMEDLIPLLKKLAGGREIVGLKAYE